MKIDNAEKVDVASNQSSLQTPASPVLATAALIDGAGQKATSKVAIEAMNSEDMDYIRTHGARAYAELLQNKIVQEIRNKLLVLMNLSDTPEEEIPLLQRQTIEGLIAVEIHTRLQASHDIEANSVSDNSTYLKTMLLTQGNYGFFKGLPITSLDEFESGVSGRDKTYQF
ncbi:MAG: hypothetical protein HQ483_20995 [Rhodospirillales bacterium]|nr:hypothetical protein [Rhodospirillales bacterium]